MAKQIYLVKNTEGKKKLNQLLGCAPRRHGPNTLTCSAGILRALSTADIFPASYINHFRIVLLTYYSLNEFCFLRKATRVIFLE